MLEKRRSLLRFHRGRLDQKTALTHATPPLVKQNQAVPSCDCPPRARIKPDRWRATSPDSLFVPDIRNSTSWMMLIFVAQWIPYLFHFQVRIRWVRQRDRKTCPCSFPRSAWKCSPDVPRSEWRRRIEGRYGRPFQGDCGNEDTEKFFHQWFNPGISYLWDNISLKRLGTIRGNFCLFGCQASYPSWWKIEMVYECWPWFTWREIMGWQYSEFCYLCTLKSLLFGPFPRVPLTLIHRRSDLVEITKVTG